MLAVEKYIENTSFTAPWDTEKWKALYSRLWDAYEAYKAEKGKA